VLKENERVLLPVTEGFANESDVEQKFVFPFLCAPQPTGLGFPTSSIKTKPNIKRFLIGKGSEQKLYYPDYLIVLLGFPLMVVEAKGPGEDLGAAYREARLYANELNASFPSRVNPVRYAAVTNGNRLWAGPVDSNTPAFDVAIDELHSSSQTLSDLQSEIAITAIEPVAAELAASLTQRPFRKPLKLLGGQSVRNEEIGHNSFGATIALDYRHLFNPTTREERAFVAKEAYIPSKRRERYIDPIDRITRSEAA